MTVIDQKLHALQLLDAALFTQAPKIGSTDCTHEVKYAGYRRVPLISDGTTNLTPVTFPASEQDAKVLVTHVALIDSAGVIQAVFHISEKFAMGLGDVTTLSCKYDKSPGFDFECDEPDCGCHEYFAPATRLQHIVAMSQEMANDEQLWSQAQNAAEARLQEALRRRRGFQLLLIHTGNSETQQARTLRPTYFHFQCGIPAPTQAIRCGWRCSCI